MRQVKFIPILILGVFLLLRCNVPRQTYSFCNFSTQGKYVLCGTDTTAILTNVEYKTKRDRQVKELTYTILESDQQIDISKLRRYLNRDQSEGGWEIELIFNIK